MNNIEQLRAELKSLDAGQLVDWYVKNQNVIWNHHSGRQYIIVMVTNNSVEPTPQYPWTFVYRNVQNGSTWSRPVQEWLRSFTPDYTVLPDLYNPSKTHIALTHYIAITHQHPKGGATYLKRWGDFK